MKTPDSKRPRTRRITSKSTAKKNVTKEEFPGYPHYSPDEDILKQGERIDTDIENVKTPDANKVTRVEEIPQPSIDDQPDAPVSDPYAVTSEDLQALGPEDLSMDGGEDEELRRRGSPADFSGSDLDVPGSELDDDRERLGSEDEENNTYSLGGDRHEDLEEDQS